MSLSLPFRVGASAGLIALWFGCNAVLGYYFMHGAIPFWSISLAMPMLSVPVLWASILIWSERGSVFRRKLMRSLLIVLLWSAVLLTLIVAHEMLIPMGRAFGVLLYAGLILSWIFCVRGVFRIWRD